MTSVLDAAGATKQTPGIKRGIIAIFSGSAVPEGWALCDGTLGTPDLSDRFIVGDSAVGTGSAGGTVSATAGLTHAGAAVGNHSNHVVTQPAAHPAHSVTQPAAHDDHVVTQANDHGTHAANFTHTHNSHGTGAATAGATAVIADNFVHSADGAHTHDAHSAHVNADLDAHSAHSAANLDAHSAHAGAAVDAHSAHGVTQPSTHSVLKHYILAWVMKL